MTKSRDHWKAVAEKESRKRDELLEEFVAAQEQLTETKEALAEWKADCETHYQAQITLEERLSAALDGKLAACKAETVMDRLAFAIIPGLMLRYRDPGYQDSSLVSEAYRLAAFGLKDRDHYIAPNINRGEERSPRLNSNESESRKEGAA